MNHFKLREGHLADSIILIIHGKPHKAKIRVAQQRSPKWDFSI